MTHTVEDRTLALAGVFQAVQLVKQIAHQGSAPADNFEASLGSIFNTQPATTAAVYGGVRNVMEGIKLLRIHMGGTDQVRDLEITRYVVAILYLERQLAKRPPMLQQIGDGIEKARAQAEHFVAPGILNPSLRSPATLAEPFAGALPCAASKTHSNVIASLAGLYSDTISTLTPRIIVSGEQGYLSNTENANKVRALLLAAIRSAVLWRQCGGGRLQLIFGRNKMVREAEHLLKMD